jgi:hypothetical protein
VKTRAGTALAYALVVVLAVELAVWECFLVGARPFGTGLPVAALLAAVANAVLGVAGARVLGRRLGAVIPSSIWLLIALPLASGKRGSDLIVTNNWRGLLFLLLGALSAAVVVGGIGTPTATRATPGPPDSR